MAIVVTPNTTNANVRGSLSYAITGMNASTDYTVQLTDGTGQRTTTRIVSDGSGNATVNFVPQAKGKITVVARPTAEHTGTTAAVLSDATVTATR
jgi:hypothetical protein